MPSSQFRNTAARAPVTNPTALLPRRTTTVTTVRYTPCGACHATDTPTARVHADAHTRDAEATRVRPRYTDTVMRAEARLATDDNAKAALVTVAVAACNPAC